MKQIDKVIEHIDNVWMELQRCAIIWQEYNCKSFKKFAKHAMPVIIKDFPAFKEFVLKIYGINITKGEYKTEEPFSDVIHN